MKKQIVLMTMLATAIATANAQGFLNKLKDKVSDAVNKKPANQPPADEKKGTHADPANYGVVLISFTQADFNSHSGADGIGYVFRITSAKVINNQPELKIDDFYNTCYTYSNGQFNKSGDKPNQKTRDDEHNGSEGDMLSVNFSQADMTNAMMKTGPHIGSGQQPGKMGQTYTFGGKAFANYAMATALVHNADSTVVAVSGATFNKGVKYSIAASNGVQLDVPSNAYLPLISPDGKLIAGVNQGGGMHGDAVISNGQKTTINGVLNNHIWLHNTGSIFYMTNVGNEVNVEKNGQPFHTFTMQTPPKSFFVSADETRLCWLGDHGIYFSDGNWFENATSPHKLVIDGKEVIYFTLLDLSSRKLYLCHHDL